MSKTNNDYCNTFICKKTCDDNEKKGVVNKQLTQKVAIKYYCEKCDYGTCKKSSYDKHILTSKHFCVNRVNKKVAQYFNCSKCNKFFHSRVGLWKHNKFCLSNNVIEETKTLKATQDIIQYLIKENSEFKQLMLEQNKQILEFSKINTNINNINTTNNFNLNLFLNETCKDAMNIMDFVSQLKIGVDDLEETARLGFAGGISKIFINGQRY